MLYKAYTPEIYKLLGHDSQGHGHGGADFRMDWHIIDCLRNGLPMPQDDALARQWARDHEMKEGGT